eukprot:scaffold6998_cov57-Attheya_sp.AAC.5
MAFCPPQYTGERKEGALWMRPDMRLGWGGRCGVHDAHVVLIGGPEPPPPRRTYRMLDSISSLAHQLGLWYNDTYTSLIRSQWARHLHG